MQVTYMFVLWKIIKLDTEKNVIFPILITVAYTYLLESI